MTRDCPAPSPGPRDKSEWNGTNKVGMQIQASLEQLGCEDDELVRAS